MSYKKRIALAIYLSTFCFTSISVRATTITVTNTNDSGPGSLRGAIAAAGDGDTIQFDPALKGQTITLTSGELFINSNLTITGPGPSQLTVKRSTAGGTPAFRIFHILRHTVTIEGLSIINGRALALGGKSPDAGGGIFCDDEESNNERLAVTVNNCVISGNTAGGPGGFGGGGGISFAAINCFGPSMLTLNNCTISANSCLGYNGGGIYISVCDPNGMSSVTITNSTISGNAADWSGGGIDNGGNTVGVMLTISNSTISGNTVTFDGGGIYNNGVGGHATLTINNSTLSGNSADSGGAINNTASFGGTATLDIGSSILNSGPTGGTLFNDGGTVTSHGYNLSSDDAGGLLIGPGDQINTDPLLGPLQDNGGATFTHELLPGSPAIDAGDPKFTPPPFFDQRGPEFDRVVNGRIDKGSFEVQGPAPTPSPTATATVTATPAGTPSATPTATPTPTPTPRPTPAPRPTPGTRPRPTPPPRP
jgi:hypothetical protein